MHVQMVIMLTLAASRNTGPGCWVGELGGGGRCPTAPRDGWALGALGALGAAHTDDNDQCLPPSCREGNNCRTEGIKDNKQQKGEGEREALEYCRRSHRFISRQIPPPRSSSNHPDPLVVRASPGDAISQQRNRSQGTSRYDRYENVLSFDRGWLQAVARRSVFSFLHVLPTAPSPHQPDSLRQTASTVHTTHCPCMECIMRMLVHCSLTSSSMARYH